VVGREAGLISRTLDGFPFIAVDGGHLAKSSQGLAKENTLLGRRAATNMHDSHATMDIHVEAARGRQHAGPAERRRKESSEGVADDRERRLAPEKTTVRPLAGIRAGGAKEKRRRMGFR